jgi:putative lipoic acid-binding regulatory protein
VSRSDHRSPEQYPCEFPIKVMGRRDGELASLTREIVERHAGVLPPDRVRSRSSSDGNFIAITYVIEAKSRAQLDAIYRELTACKAVVMAL